MADKRTELQVKLEELLGSGHVYYQPPTSLKMEYDAIRITMKRNLLMLIIQYIQIKIVTK